MTPIEIMALIVALFTLSKATTMLVSQKSWFNRFTSRFWHHPRVLTVVFLMVSLASLYLLLQELTIVQVVASCFFAMSLIIFGLAPLSKYMLKVEGKWFKKEKMTAIGTVQWVVWILLSAWVIYEIFF